MSLWFITLFTPTLHMRIYAILKCLLSYEKCTENRVQGVSSPNDMTVIIGYNLTRAIPGPRGEASEIVVVVSGVCGEIEKGLMYFYESVAR